MNWNLNNLRRQKQQQQKTTIWATNSQTFTQCANINVFFDSRDGLVKNEECFAWGLKTLLFTVPLSKQVFKIIGEVHVDQTSMVSSTLLVWEALSFHSICVDILRLTFGSEKLNKSDTKAALPGRR